MSRYFRLVVCEECASVVGYVDVQLEPEPPADAVLCGLCCECASHDPVNLAITDAWGAEKSKVH